MQTAIRMMVLGLMVSICATPVHGQSQAPAPATPTAPQQPAALDLTLPAAVAPQSAPVDAALLPAVAPQSPVTGAAVVPAAAPQPAPADMLQTAPQEVQVVARWVNESGDNGGMPFLLIDKVNAQVYAFNRAGQLQGAAPVLLGMAKGDRMLAPNDAPMSAMPPSVRITPAGRFVSRLGLDSKGKELLIMDYDASLSLHPVAKGTPKERRAERLNSATAEDNRISFGCINVPTAFYSSIVSPAFTKTKGIVYVLPETRSAGEEFGFQPGGAAVPGQISTAMGAGPAQAVQAPGTK